jgi:predicted ATPase/DNA-binding CsgD family transcriptional regulator
MPVAGRTVLANLPAESTSFVGRRHEVGEVKRLLAESRLVTLTGVGGTGKTRLALRAAAQLRRVFADGIWFVDLTQLHARELLTHDVYDADALAYLLGATLGVREQGGPPLRALVEQLADRRLLLVLDNCEHLISASAILAEALLRGCPGLRILATSRETLTVTGEKLFPVPPLPVPDPGDLPSLAELGRYEAVTLFVARARAALADFGLTEANHRAVAELCHRVDGSPLAIELAAARVRLLAPQEILDRLADRFALLSRGSRDAPRRQQTLRACVDWSFDLCAKPERLLWARLSVFVGGFELDAVERVCADEALPEADLLDLVAGLVDKSILDRVEVGDGGVGPARYRMLEAIRDFGKEQLVAVGEQAILRRRHRDWYRQLVAQAKADWLSCRQAEWVARLKREDPNLRAAVEFCLTEPGEAETALLIVIDLPRVYWFFRGAASEGLDWLNRALAHVTAPTVLRARALVHGGHLGLWHGNAEAGTPLLEQGEALAERLDDPFARAYADHARAHAALLGNDVNGAIECGERALAILTGMPQPDVTLRLSVLSQVGFAAHLAGDHERATRWCQEALEITEPHRNSFVRSYALLELGLIAWQQGDVRQADQQVREGLRSARKMGLQDPNFTTLSIDALAWIAAHQQRYGRAATLLGTVDTLPGNLGRPAARVPLTADHETCERCTREALGDGAFTDAFRLGQALSLDGAVAYALDDARQSGPPASERPDPSTPLTRREGQVADLLADGLSNKEIAGRLVISPRTAESHVEHILTKLGVANRAEAAAWMATQRTPDQDPTRR